MIIYKITDLEWKRQDRNFTISAIVVAECMTDAYEELHEHITGGRADFFLSDYRKGSKCIPIGNTSEDYSLNEAGVQMIAEA